MTVAGVRAKNATSAGKKKKQVHFDDRQLASRKIRAKQLGKKTKSTDTPGGAGSVKQVENEVKHTSKDDDDSTQSGRKRKEDKQQKVVPPQTHVAIKPSVNSTEDIKSRKGIVLEKRLTTDLKAKASATKSGSGSFIVEKKPKADQTKGWPLIDFKEKIKMDLSDISKITRKRPSLGGKFNDAESIMRPFFNTKRTYVPTLSLRRRSSFGMYSNNETMDVLAAVQQQMQKRRKERIQSELDTICKRVRKILEEIGMDSDSDEEESTLQLPPIHMFDTSAERKKVQERNYVIGCIETFEEKALVRKQLLTELMVWFEAHQNMCSDVVTPSEMKEIVINTQELHQIISTALQTFIINGEKVVKKGKLLLAETGKIIDERRIQMSKRTRKDKIIVYDEKALVLDPSKWESAAKTILSVFEDSHKMIKNLMFKNALRLCQKQFENMMLACDKRFKDLDDKKKQCIELQAKLHSAKLQNDRLNREIDEQKRKFTKLSQELIDTKTTLETLQERNKEIQGKILQLNSKVKLLQGELCIKNRTPTPSPTPSPPPEPEKIYVKVVDSSTELKLKGVEAELENAQTEIAVLMSQLNEANEQFKMEHEKTQSLQEKVSELESVKIPEPVPTPQIITVLETPQEVQRSSEFFEKDSGYYKTLMTGMKRDFELEMEKVKTHVRKERTRGGASIKKLELQHKDHLSHIQKDIVRMLRGIMHFREHMLVCLQKENLIDQAYALQDLGDIVKEKVSQDPKEMLASVVGIVIDYLNKMEGILSNSFLAIRVLMKYQMDIDIEQRVALKEAQMKDQEMKGAKKNVTGLARSLKKAKNKLKKAKCDSGGFSSDKKYLDLFSRYKTMMRMYKNMRTEMELLQSDFHDTLEEKETMVISQMKMEVKKKRVLVKDQLKMSIADQQQNLQMLSKAYEEKKISKELHLTATAMIQKTMEIPQRKLKNLFEQYIAYRRVQDSKNRLKRVMLDEAADLSIDTRKEMEHYVQTMETKSTHTIRKWRNEMEQLDTEKSDLHQRIYKLFSEVLIETGVLLKHPLFRDKDRANTITKAASQMNRSQLKEIVFKQSKRCKEFLTLPEELLGRAVAFGQGDKKLWTQKEPEQTTSMEAGVVLPHMLAYEINKPKINATRSLHRGRQKYQLGKTESFNISCQNYVQFIRDIPLHDTEMETFVIN